MQLCSPQHQHDMQAEQVAPQKGVFTKAGSFITCLCNLVRYTCIRVEKLRDFSVDNRSIFYRSYLAHYKVGLRGEVMGSGQLTNVPCFSAPALG